MAIPSTMQNTEQLMGNDEDRKLRVRLGTEAPSGTDDMNGNGIPDWQEIKQTETVDHPSGGTIVTQRKWVKPASLESAPSEQIPQGMTDALNRQAMPAMQSMANTLATSPVKPAANVPTAKDLYQAGAISYDQYLNATGRGSSSVLAKRDLNVVANAQRNFKDTLGQGYALKRAELDTAGKIAAPVGMAEGQRFQAVGEAIKGATTSAATIAAAQMNRDADIKKAGIDAEGRVAVADKAGQWANMEAQTKNKGVVAMGTGGAYNGATGQTIAPAGSENAGQLADAINADGTVNPNFKWDPVNRKIIPIRKQKESLATQLPNGETGIPATTPGAPAATKAPTAMSEQTQAQAKVLADYLKSNPNLNPAKKAEVHAWFLKNGIPAQNIPGV